MNDSVNARDLAGGGGWEWLEPDGLGGYAMGTAGGPATRRYHALLCSATTPPTGRVVLVNATSERFVSSNADQALDAHYYPGTVFPDGHTRIERFSIDPWPTWRYAVQGGLVLRELCCVCGRAGVLLRYTFVAQAGAAAARLIVRPLASGRDSHALHHENAVLDPRAENGDGYVEMTPYPGAIPGVRIVHNGAFSAAPDWYRRCTYPVEAERGLPDEEDLFSAGELAFDLSSGPALIAMAPIGVAGSLATITAREIVSTFETERARRAARAPQTDPDAALLVAAAEAFVVRATEGAKVERTTVIAGYPWFTDWGRDTFICSRGLGLAFGPSLERALLLAWEPYLSAGMIPNRFDESGPSEYNAVDASLWYALRAARHLRTTASAPIAVDANAEAERRAKIGSAVRRVIEGYLGGTRHGIHIDDDGLVNAAEAGQQLTWMDAKVGDWVITPRAGKPIEIQALWVAALEASARLFLTEDPHFSTELAERAAWARSSFAARYWCESRGYLYDVIDGPSRDETLRPNQLYALGLVRPLVDPDRARRALEAVERELLVPVGLRTRARGPHYRGRMVGDQRARDGAYHEGTAWPFLLGIYADACQRVRGKVPPAILNGVLTYVRGPGLGQLAECFDGDAPHLPRGCPAQAWSIAETLRVQLGAIAED